MKFIPYLLLALFGITSVASASLTAEPITGTESDSLTVVQADQLVMPGRYADADIVALDDGTYLMYFGVEPETPGNNLEIYVAESIDGVNWTKFETPVLTQATFPDAIVLQNGIRLYFQRAGEIYSAFSSDGLVDWAVEEGVRVEKTGKLDSDGIAAPTVVKRPDDTYYMIFRAAVAKRFKANSVNPTTTALISATSTDGLTWKRGKVVENGRKKIFDGYIDGPELFYDADGKLHLRFWAPGGTNEGAKSGQFEKISKNNGKKWKKSKLVVADILGGDPTYIYIDGKLYMYYSIYSEGIYLRIIEE